MALSGVHIACGYVNAPPGPALLGAVAWSQTMATPGATASAAPMSGSGPSGATGANLAFEVRSSADVYVAIGGSPDAAQASGSGASARIFVPANETRNLFCAPGDRLAWTLA